MKPIPYQSVISELSLLFLACVFFKRKETMSYSSLNPSLNIVGIQQTFEEQTG